jgi:hypothetical protein
VGEESVVGSPGVRHLVRSLYVLFLRIPAANPSKNQGRQSQSRREKHLTREQSRNRKLEKSTWMVTALERSRPAADAAHYFTSSRKTRVRYSADVNQGLRNFSRYQRPLSTERESNPHPRRIFATRPCLVEGKLARASRLGETTHALLALHIPRARPDSARMPCGYSEQSAHTIARTLGSCCRKCRKFCPA